MNNAIITVPCLVFTKTKLNIQGETEAPDGNSLLSYLLSLLLSLFLSFFILESVLALAAQGKTKCSIGLFAVQNQDCSNVVYMEYAMLAQILSMTCADLWFHS